MLGEKPLPSGTGKEVTDKLRDAGRHLIDLGGTSWTFQGRGRARGEKNPLIILILGNLSHKEERESEACKGIW